MGSSWIYILTSKTEQLPATLFVSAPELLLGALGFSICWLKHALAEAALV